MKRSSKIFSAVFIIFMISTPFLSILLNNNTSNSTIINDKSRDIASSAYSEATATDWWDATWFYRYEIDFQENPITSPINVSERLNEPIDIYLTFQETGAAINDSIRVVYFDGSSWSSPVQSQVWNETYYGGNTYLLSCNVLFFINISQSSDETYYIYFNQTAPAPGYTDLIWSNPYNDGSKADDTANPDVTNTLGNPTVTGCDTINITTALGTMSQIELIDTLDMYRNLSGPVCSLISLKYGADDALRYDPTTAGAGGQFFQLNDFALDDNGNPGEADWGCYSGAFDLLTPDNPAEATNGEVVIEENGSLFVRLKIITDVGGYEEIEMNHVATDKMNFTMYYNFYYYQDACYVTLDNTINFIQTCYVKNYGQWPHVFGVMSDDAAFEQNRRSWNGSVTQFPNDTLTTSRKDYPYEPWVAVYHATDTSVPSIGIINLNTTLGYEVASQCGDDNGGYNGNAGIFGNSETLIYQPVLVQGHQGDYYTLPAGSSLNTQYAVLTTAQSDNYTKIREFAFRLNNPIDMSVGVREEFENNVVVLNAIDRDGAPIPNALVYLLNSTTKAVVTSGTTDANGNATLTGLADGNYDVVVNFTIQSQIYNLNYSTITLDHVIQRVYYEQYNCTLANFTALVVDADDQVALNNAKIRLGNGTIGPDFDNFMFDGYTNSTGHYGMQVLSGYYTINISYGGVDERVNNLTQPVQIVNQATGTMTIGCVVTEVKTDAVLLNTNATYNALLDRYECYVNEKVFFNINYTNTDDNEGIPGANQSDWSLSVGTNTVDSGTLTEDVAGNYTFIYNSTKLNISSNYVLLFEFDKNYPAEYIYAFKQVNLYVNPYPTTFNTTDEASYIIPWGDNFTIHTTLNDSYIAPGTPLTSANLAINGWSSSFYSITEQNGQYNITFNSTNKLTDDTIQIEIVATKTNFSSSSLYFTINIKERDTSFSAGSVSPVPYNNDSVIDL